MKVAIIEPYGFHDELLPSWVLACNQLGIVPDVYTRRRNFKKNIFYFCPQLVFRRHLYNKWLTTDAPAPKGYDFWVLNTLDNYLTPDVSPYLLDGLGKVTAPVLGVVHDIRKITHTPLPPHVTLSVIAPIMQTELKNNNINSLLFWPVYLGDVPRPNPSQWERLRLVVQGNVDNTRRDYAALLDLDPNYYECSLIGGGDKPFARTFKAEVARRGLSQTIHFEHHLKAYRAYYPSLINHDYLLPLIHDKPEYARYFKDGASSTINATLALGLPMLINQRLADLYYLKGACAVYADDLPTALADLVHQDRQPLIAHLQQKQQQLLAHNRVMLYNWLRQVV
jgi:hypothetical protein